MAQPLTPPLAAAQLDDLPSRDARRERPRPLCVDLDGTLVATDLLWESLFSAAKSRPVDLLRLPIWLRGGKANVKRLLAEGANIDPATLPYREEVLEFIKRRKAEGHRLILTTAADESVARKVADHLGLFDDVLASDGRMNLSGSNKVQAIRALVGGDGKFDYIGNCDHDLPLWKEAAESFVVSSSARVIRQARGVCTPARVFDDGGSGRLRAVVKAIRPHQWAKNALLFVPMGMGHQLNRWTFFSVLIAVFAFSLCASAVYVLNDLLDLQADRQHRTKRRRPFASGALPVQLGPPLLAGLLLVGCGAAAAVSLPFLAVVVFYLLLTTAYSFYFKRKLLLDVVCLAGLYTYRLLAGGVAAQVVPSPWLLAFSMFLFFSLAFAKRYTELAHLRDGGAGSDGGPKKAAGRGYRVDDLGVILAAGPASGYLAVLVVALYISDNEAAKLYRGPELLWLICPVLLYWITRVWFLASRGQLKDDPVVFALKDRVSYLAGALVLLLLLLATIWRLPGLRPAELGRPAPTLVSPQSRGAAA